MKSTLKLLIIVLILTYCLDKIVYLVLNKISDQVMSGQSIGKLNQFLSKKDSLNLIAFGTSRSNHHIDVKKLNTSSYNMGMDGSSIAYAATLIKLLPKEKKQTVLLNIDPNKLFDDTYDGSDLKALATKYNRNKTIKEAIKNANQNSNLQYFFWSLDYNGKTIGIIKNYFLPKYDFESYYGFDPLDVSQAQTEQFKTRLQIKSSYNCDKKKEINLTAWKYIHDITVFCKNNNKNLILLTTPTYKPTCKIQYIKLAEKLKSINVTYKNYSDFFVTNNDITYWKDKTHLSSKGASIFSEFLKQDLEKNNLINQND